jgi:hypothetical protein
MYWRCVADHSCLIGNDVVFQIGHDRFLTPVQRRITDAVNARIGFDFSMSRSSGPDS